MKRKQGKGYRPTMLSLKENQSNSPLWEVIAFRREKLLIGSTLGNPFSPNNVLIINVLRFPRNEK